MKALITGITGQDGSYLAELLLSKGYEVFGVIRRSSSFNTGRIDQIYQDPHVPDAHLRLVDGDLNNASSLNRILRTVRPDEIYNLGAQSHDRGSFDIPEYTEEVTGVGAVRLLEAIRDWGYAGDYVEAMWLMLQQEEPDDYVIATGESHTVRELLELAFEYVHLDWKKYVKNDPRYYRPTEVDQLVGDASKAKRKLGWEPKVSFKELITMMVETDLKAERLKLEGTRSQP